MCQTRIINVKRDLTCIEKRPTMCPKRLSMCGERRSIRQMRPIMCEKRRRIGKKRLSMCGERCSIRPMRPIMCEKRRRIGKKRRFMHQRDPFHYASRELYCVLKKNPLYVKRDPLCVRTTHYIVCQKKTHYMSKETHCVLERTNVCQKRPVRVGGLPDSKEYQ